MGWDLVMVVCFGVGVVEMVCLRLGLRRLGNMKESEVMGVMCLR